MLDRLLFEDIGGQDRLYENVWIDVIIGRDPVDLNILRSSFHKDAAVGVGDSPFNIRLEQLVPPALNKVLHQLMVLDLTRNKLMLVVRI
jgi:hypothetical protein